MEVRDRSLLTQCQYGEKLMYAVTTRKMEVLMQSISAATKVGYRRSWKHRVSFCKGRNQAVWLDSRDEGWGGNLMNFILSEHDVLWLRASTIRGKVSAIRFFHLVSGKNDFARVGARWKFLIKGLSTADKSVNRRLPYNTELLEFGRQKLLIDSPERDHRFGRVWIATLVGFMFLLRASELEALHVRDVTFGEYDGTRYVRISIRKSKNGSGGVWRVSKLK